ncbi:MAG: sodium transport system ATP-binding protein [Candidatus Sumerlaeota bacterium]|nr:sodium transport system ATP-binding protein [Candidatus Sumerlaeota bacterium]
MIEARLLTKSFRDRRRGAINAVSEVSFTCQPGKVFGLLGPNGAGKTTTLRLISTALRPTSGTALVDGIDVAANPAGVRTRIGFLSANTGLYGRLTAREVLRYFGRLNGMEKEPLETRIADLAVLFDLGAFLDRPCDKLSTGMKQRVNIARTVVHDPPVLILDEPTAGLDVLSSRTIVTFIRTQRDAGKTILFSTHIMPDVERLCDTVGIIHQGRLFYEGTLDGLRERHGEDLEDAFVRMVTAAA